MTLQEAKKQLETSEYEIKSSYSNLKSDADSVGTNAVSAASSTAMKRTAFPLCISLVGFIVLAFSTLAGIACIVGGGFLTYKTYQAASLDEKKIKESYRSLTSQIDSHPNI